MNRQHISLSLQDGKIVATVFDGVREMRSEYVPFDSSATPQAQAEYISAALDIPEADMVLCPGGLLKPLHTGTYKISALVESDCALDVYGYHPYNRLTQICFQLATFLKASPLMHNPISSDELLPLNRFSSMERVKKQSRYPACEHAALIWEAVKEKREKRPDEVKAIVAIVDDFVSVGAHDSGRCIDVNDVFGAEGPMGFTCSGDLPVAKIAALCIRENWTSTEAREKLMKRSGVLAYLGIDSPEKLDELVDSGNEKAILVTDALAYQAAKWVGSSALALHGKVDFIIVSGKGARSNSFRSRFSEKVRRISPIIVMENIPMANYLAYVANSVNSPVNPVLRY